LRTLAFRDALMGKASCFLWNRRMDCGKTRARSRWFIWWCAAAIVRFHPNL